ncbi:MAG: hypothetical protein JSV52_14215 [Candidatus Zixiibacteriota bacterium]|nr:MAG: hypothetical protein JSV52_14215 [candidate division Zixibacteria bacterium]
MLNRILLLLVLSLLFWGLGCSENFVDSDRGLELPNLNDQFGGFTASDEKPAFDDPDLLAQIDNDEGYKDPIMELAGIDTFLADDEAGFYHLRIVWGRLRLDTTVTDATDWSGSLSVNRGAEIIRRVIRFEPNQDYIHPRTDRKLIEWTSRTSVHNDGIAVDIVVGRSNPVLNSTTTYEITSENDTTVTVVVDTAYPVIDPVEVVVKTGLFNSTFTLTEISALDTIIYLDDSNAVALHGLRLDHRPCPRGFLTGTWGVDENGLGVFEGLWVTRNGYVTGFLKGHYGQNDDGLNVFKGKWISRSGLFEGFLVGTYGYELVDDTELEEPRGYFRGRIYSADRIAIGILKGRYQGSPLADAGFFQGRWRIICPDLQDLTNDVEENF